MGHGWGEWTAPIGHIRLRLRPRHINGEIRAVPGRPAAHDGSASPGALAAASIGTLTPRASSACRSLHRLATMKHAAEQRRNERNAEWQQADFVHEIRLRRIVGIHVGDRRRARHEPGAHRLAPTRSSATLRARSPVWTHTAVPFTAYSYVTMGRKLVLPLLPRTASTAARLHHRRHRPPHDQPLRFHDHHPDAGERERA